MTRNILIGVGALAAAALVLLLSAMFTVHQTQQALVLQFGEPIRVIRDPGLHFKLPLIQNAVYIDRRVLDFDASSEEVILGDQKRLVVDSFARYRITDPLRFYQTVGSETVLRARINTMLDAAMRKVLGEAPLFTVLSADRGELMNRIRESANAEARQYGIEVVDMRIKRADLPAENSQAIYLRMQTEREREAKELRAQGYELAQRIRSRADRERRVIIAEAQKEAQIVRGEGDAQAIKLYADAFGKDIDFFTFYRSMQAYRDALGDDSTSFILSPDGDFFRFFHNYNPAAAEPREAGSQLPSDTARHQQEVEGLVDGAAGSAPADQPVVDGAAGPAESRVVNRATPGAPGVE
jgi:membrane protease subunit HflC